MKQQINRRAFIGAAAAASLLPHAAFAKGSTRWPSVQALTDRWMAEKKIAGASTALGYGVAPVGYVNSGMLALDSKTEVDENTLWRIYSMSKPITAAAAMMMIEEGRIALDQPVAEVLPALANLKVATDYKTSLDGVPARNRITMRHLLTHTAGFSYNILPDGALSAAYAARGITPGANGALIKQLGLGPQAQGLQDMVARLAELPLVAEPGTVWHYSVGLDVMGAVIERVTGKGLDLFLRERIFQPLGMMSTTFRVEPRDFGRLSSNYFVARNGLILLDGPPNSGFAAPPAMLSGGGGLVSSARDYARFAKMLLGRGQLGGTRIMKGDTVALMTSNLLPPGVAGPDGTGFGAGGRVILPGGNSRFGTAGSYAWAGAAGTLFSIDPARNGLMVFMTQYMPSESYAFRDELPPAIRRDLDAMKG